MKKFIILIVIVLGTYTMQAQVIGQKYYGSKTKTEKIFDDLEIYSTFIYNTDKNSVLTAIVGTITTKDQVQLSFSHHFVETMKEGAEESLGFELKQVLMPKENGLKNELFMKIEDGMQYTIIFQERENGKYTYGMMIHLADKESSKLFNRI